MMNSDAFTCQQLLPPRDRRTGMETMECLSRNVTGLSDAGWNIFSP